ncbi:Pantothenate kinase 4 [Coemansia sp. RSA 2559]|nr:Pantothenate kinase 4 [Coemansia sp. RSA 2559]
MEHTVSSRASATKTSISIGMDIGGTFAKFVLLDKDAGAKDLEHAHPLEKLIHEMTQAAAKGALPLGWIAESIGQEPEGGHAVVLRALGVPTTALDGLVAKITASTTGSSTGLQALRVAATGGGALRLKDELEAKLAIELVVVHELQALVRGWQPNSMAFDQEVPALICNVGTGVSMVHVTGKGAAGFERVSGSGIGASTFWTLAKRMTSFGSFEEAVVAAMASGDAQKVDTLVGDIYGVETSKAIGMPPDLVAGFLGKIDDPELTDADVVAALLRMFANNLGQLAVFQARLLELDNVWFAGGCFGSVGSAGGSAEARACMGLRKAVEESVGFWSAGKVAARFPNNASFVGAAGAVLEAASGH